MLPFAFGVIRATVAEAGGDGVDLAPEEGRILGRLRQIFGLKHD